MKVAFLTMGKDIGGAKQDVLTLSQKIAAHGHDVFVIAAPGVIDRELTGTTISNWLTRKAFLRQLLHG